MGAWRGDGALPEEVELEALYQQRLFIHLTGKPALSRAVLGRLRGRIRREAAETLAARAALVRLTPPTRKPLRSFRTGPPAPARSLLRWYQGAERRYGVGWHVLAAVNFVESAFGKLRSDSTAGAQGPMQFVPGTWRSYGLAATSTSQRRYPVRRKLPARAALRATPRRALRYNRSTRSWTVPPLRDREARRPAFYSYYALQSGCGPLPARAPHGPGF